jgi:hypothetical protein
MHIFNPLPVFLLQAFTLSLSPSLRPRRRLHFQRPPSTSHLHAQPPSSTCSSRTPPTHRDGRILWARSCSSTTTPRSSQPSTRFSRPSPLPASISRSTLSCRNAKPSLRRLCPTYGPWRSPSTLALGRSSATSSCSMTCCRCSTTTMTKASLTSRCSCCAVAATVEGKPGGKRRRRSVGIIRVE